MTIRLYIGGVPVDATPEQITQLKTDLGLHLVNNTPDAEKPISTPTAAAIAAITPQPPTAALTGNTNLIRASHANRQVPLSSAVAFTVTLTNDATGGWGGDDCIEMPNEGTAAVTLAAVGGVTLDVPAGFKRIAQPGETLTATRVGPDKWRSTLSVNPQAALSGVTYDGSDRVTGYTKEGVAHVVTYPNSTTIVDTPAAGSLLKIQTTTLDVSGRVTAVNWS
jgi:hypothetical protein